MGVYEIYPQEAEELCRSLGIERSITQEQRDAIPDEDFALPSEHKFPINSQSHLDAAAKLIGHAPEAEQEAIKKHAIAIAKRKGYTLPESWQEGEKSDESKDETQDRTLLSLHVDEPTETKEVAGIDNFERAVTEKVTVPAFPDAILSLDGYTPHLTFPIVRADADKWLVYGRATVEEPDHHGTVFSYEGAKAAFKRWKGNIREQHDHKKAVGKRVDYDFDGDSMSVNLLARVSKGAPDTWAKVLDDTLCDFSVSVIPAEQYGTNPRNWPKKEFNGKMYPYLPEYDYAEISLVDSGSAPGTRFTPIVRADGSPTEILEVIEDEPVAAQLTQDRAGARMSAETKAKMHSAIKNTLHAAKAQMENCGCDACVGTSGSMDPDNYDNPDANSSSQDDQDMERTILGIIERALQPVYARLQGIAGTLSRSGANTKPLDLKPIDFEATFDTLITGAITRAVDAATAANNSNFAEVRADLSAVKEQVVKIADTPMPGAPVMNTSAIPRPSTPIDKRLATDPYARPKSSGSAVYDAVKLMARTGDLKTTEQQVDAVAMALAEQRRG